MTHDLHDLITWSTRLFLLPASWPYRGLPWLLDCSELQLFMKFVSAPNPDNKWMFLFFFGRIKQARSPKPIASKKGFFIPARSPILCAARSSDLSEEQSSIHLHFGHQDFSPVDGPRDSEIQEGWDALGYLFDVETNQQKNAARPSEFFWELHGPNVPWDLKEILLPAGWFLATSIPWFPSPWLWKSHFISFLFDPRSCFESHFVSVRLGRSKWS